MVKEVFGEEVGTTRQSVLAAAKWRSMSDEEKKPFLARAEQEKLMYEVARRQYEEQFVDPDERDDARSGGGPQHHSSSIGGYSYVHGNGQLMGSDGFTLSGHFVGIEQLSLDDTFIGSTTSSHTNGNRNANGGSYNGSVTGTLSNIKAFQVANENAHILGADQASLTKAEISEDEIREALQQGVLQGITN